MQDVGAALRLPLPLLGTPAFLLREGSFRPGRVPCASFLLALPPSPAGGNSPPAAGLTPHGSSALLLSPSSGNFHVTPLCQIHGSAGSAAELGAPGDSGAGRTPSRPATAMRDIALSLRVGDCLQLGLDSLVLRLYLLEWEEAVRCALLYASAAQRTVKELAALASSLGGGSTLGPRPGASPTATTGAAVAGAPVCNASALRAWRAELGSVAVEAVGSGGHAHASGGSPTAPAPLQAVTPACSLHASVCLELACAGPSSWHAQATLPRLQLGVSALRPDVAVGALGRLPVDYPLLGVRHFSYSHSMGPAAPCEGETSTSGQAGRGGARPRRQRLPHRQSTPRSAGLAVV
jgi:hypothetical protein